MGLVSTNILEHDNLVQKFIECGMEKLDDNSLFLLHDGKHKIFLDGEWVGICRDSSSFVAKLRRKRRRTEVPHQVYVYSFNIIACISVVC